MKQERDSSCCGKAEIPHTVAENLNQVFTMLQAERDENIARKDFTPTEALDIGGASGTA